MRIGCIQKLLCRPPSLPLSLLQVVQLKEGMSTRPLEPALTLLRRRKPHQHYSAITGMLTLLPPCGKTAMGEPLKVVLLRAVAAAPAAAVAWGPVNMLA